MKQILATLLLLLLAFTACTTQTVVDEDDEAADGTTIVNERTIVRDETVVADGEGRIITGITGSASQSMKITIDSVELYNEAENDWVIIASDEDTYDLASLNDLRLAGDEQIDAGTYTQLRLDISSAIINGRDAQIPAEKFVVPVSLAVPAGSTTVVAIDIHGDESLDLVNGRYVFTPIVSVNTCVDATAMVNDRVVTTTCRVAPVVETYEQDISGRVVVNTVVREVPVIRVVERTEVTNNNTYVYNNTVVRETTVEDDESAGNSTNTTSSSGSATTGTQTSATA